VTVSIASGTSLRSQQHPVNLSCLPNPAQEANLVGIKLPGGRGTGPPAHAMRPSPSPGPSP